MLDLRRLMIFREVAARGSITAAAEALDYTQPAVSRQIATLEAEAGRQLLERVPQGIRLTDAGAVLLDHAHAIATQVDLAEDGLRALDGLERGRVRLAAFPTADTALVPDAIARFRRAHPGVELKLSESISERSLERLRAGEVDLAVVSDHESQRLDLTGVDLTHLVDDPAYLALARHHPLARKRRLRLADLRDESWIEAGQQGYVLPLLSACRKVGFEPRIEFEVGPWNAKQGLVAAGVGVCLIPSLALSAVRQEVVLRPLGADAPKREVFAATRAGNRSPAAERMVELLLDAARRCERRAADLVARRAP